MAEPTLQEVFGPGATQSANSITILKADLATTGLTSAGNNRAESLLTAIVMRASIALTEGSRLPDLVNRNVTCTYAGQDRVTQGGQPFQRDVYSILLYKSTTNATVNPNDY